MHAEPSLNPFRGLDFNWMFDRRVGATPGKDFLIWQPFDQDCVRYTFKDFADEVARFSGRLLSLGVSAGDRVLIHLDNCPEFLIAYFACAKLGAVAVTTNTRSTLEELQYFAQHSGCVGYITQPRYRDLVERTARAAQWKIFIAHDSGVPSDIDIPAACSWSGPADAVAGQGGAPIDADPDRILAVQYTSGTTSKPKGVVITHGNALWAGRVNAVHCAYTGDDVLQVFLPLFHTNAMSYGVLGALWSGASIVLQPKFSVSRFWEVAVRHRCTFASMTQFCGKALLSAPAPRTHHFRQWASSNCNPDYAVRFGVPTIGWYGMTETISHPIVGLQSMPNEGTAVGRPAAEYLVKVVDDAGHPVPPGHTGHLLVKGVRGVSLFAGYFNDEQATRKSFDADGWFITGDKVTLQQDGCVRFADRSAHVLKVGGENVSTSEIEAVLLRFDGVLEAGVVGKPDELYGQRPVAFVKVQWDGDQRLHAQRLEALAAFLRDHLSDFKVPREIRVIDSFPRGTLDKMLKHKLVEML